MNGWVFLALCVGITLAVIVMACRKPRRKPPLKVLYIGVGQRLNDKPLDWGRVRVEDGTEPFDFFGRERDALPQQVRINPLRIVGGTDHGDVPEDWERILAEVNDPEGFTKALDT